MSKTIEFSDQDYERIRQAADAAEMPLAEWVAANLPLNGNGTHPQTTAAQPCAEGKSVRTMADALAGRVGLIGSGRSEPVARNHSQIFGDLLEEKRRAGHL